MPATAIKLLGEYWLVINRGAGRGQQVEYRYTEPREKRPSLRVWQTETHEYTATFDALDDAGAGYSVRPPSGARYWSQLPKGTPRPSFIPVVQDRPSTVWMRETVVE